MQWAYVKGGLGIAMMFAGAFIVGRGAMLLVAGTILVVVFAATMTRRDIEAAMDQRSRE
jgi:predicted DNA repair protein MutK